MIHVKPDNLGITCICDYGPQYKVETVQVSAQEEVGRRAESQVLRFEESASRASPEVPYASGDVRFAAKQQIPDITGTEQILISWFGCPVTHRHQGDLFRMES